MSDRTLLGRLIGSQPLPQFTALVRKASIYDASTDTVISVLAETQQMAGQSITAVSSCSIAQYPERLAVYESDVDPEFVLGHPPVLSDSAFLASHGFVVARTTHVTVDFFVTFKVPRNHRHNATADQLTRLTLASLAGLEQVLRQIYHTPSSDDLVSTDPWQFADSTLIASPNMP